MESTTILGALFGLVTLMLVFFLYINRKWCFNSTPGFPCCDENSLPSKYVHKMGKHLIQINYNFVFFFRSFLLRMNTFRRKRLLRQLIHVFSRKTYSNLKASEPSALLRLIFIHQLICLIGEKKIHNFINVYCGMPLPTLHIYAMTSDNDGILNSLYY